VEIGAFYTLISLPKTFELSMEDVIHGHTDSVEVLFAAEAVFHGLLRHFHHRRKEMSEDDGGDEELAYDYGLGFEEGIRSLLPEVIATVIVLTAHARYFEHKLAKGMEAPEWLMETRRESLGMASDLLRRDPNMFGKLVCEMEERLVEMLMERGLGGEKIHVLTGGIE
jgi:hypothetical protein